MAYVTSLEFEAFLDVFTNNTAGEGQSSLSNVFLVIFSVSNSLLGIFQTNHVRLRGVPSQDFSPPGGPVQKLNGFVGSGAYKVSFS